MVFDFILLTTKRTTRKHIRIMIMYKLFDNHNVDCHGLEDNPYSFSSLDILIYGQIKFRGVGDCKKQN